MTIIKMLVMLHYLGAGSAEVPNTLTFDSMEDCGRVAEALLNPMQGHYGADGITITCYDATEVEGTRS